MFNEEYVNEIVDETTEIEDTTSDIDDTVEVGDAANYDNATERTRGIANVAALVEYERLVATGKFEEQVLAHLSGRFGDDLYYDTTSQYARESETLERYCKQELIDLENLKPQVIANMKCYGLAPDKAIERIRNGYKPVVTKDNKELNDDDKKALKRLQQLQPGSNWTEEKYKELML